jgi:uncharacterized membrane protein YjfL (UPF0719 family)
MELNSILIEFAKNIGWAVVASLAMSLSLGILLAVYDKLTPRIDEWEELKKGNIAVAIVLAAVILAYGFVVGMIVHGGTVVNLPK